ncbi:MAG: enoyl-CoA hydratase/isomerase family protein, partial [Planctomycetes bacterium]|nr:enoyl-CoA hydratase/isomerase family protein [Planctomycetota bacterium]
MADHTHVVLDREGKRANVTFRTEAGLNVASVEMMAELEGAVDELAMDADVRFVLFRAEGKAFLAGANIKAMAGYDAAEGRAMSELGHRVFNKIEALPQVTLVAIQGAALGGGCELAMACDFRFAVKSINIGQPEVLLGLIPGWGGTIRLPKLVGPALAKQL